jgi:hypothetical protein
VRLPLVVQTRTADADRLGHQLYFLALGHQLPRRRMCLPAAHSPSTFFRISICKALRPSARSSCLMRLTCSSSGRAAALLPQAQPELPSPLHLSSDKTGWERSRTCGRSRRCSPTSDPPSRWPVSLLRFAVASAFFPSRLLAEALDPINQACPVLGGCTTIGSVSSVLKKMEAAYCATSMTFIRAVIIKTIAR